ncbi:hypothetical protein EV382_2794 [Micromonospora violae]|uniref:Uncharacterized protein n=1 Tax=Micromonospora violae TaxID=1278207 RepID=A0A4Q7UJ14_9ACTN|nr:hypothetical protein EV382_2794 [Micromonospora violae]
MRDLTKPLVRASALGVRLVHGSSEVFRGRRLTGVFTVDVAAARS